MSSRSNRRQAAEPRHYFDAIRSFESIVKLEHDFFSELQNRKTQFTNVRLIQQATRDSVRFVQDPKSGDLNVLVDFEVYDNDRCRRQTMFLGSRLQPEAGSKDAQVTHCICLVEDQNWIAKIHFDRDFSRADLGGKPTPHIQVGDRPLPQLEKRIRGKIFWMEDAPKPRVPSIPFCTALLWHWAFIEYGCDATVIPFIEDDWWKRQVRAAEHAVLEQFFSDGFRLMRDKPGASLLKAFYTSVAT
jgi:hypothetical protein